MEMMEPAPHPKNLGRMQSSKICVPKTGLQRRSPTNAMSKRIRKILRARMREKRNHRIANILKDFRQLGDMEIAHFDPFRPCKGSSHNKPVPAEFASFLADIFKVEDELKHFSAPGCFAMIDPLPLQNSKFACPMRVNKCHDSQGLVVEMFKHGGPVLWNTLIGLFNTILTTGTIETHWRNTLFMMIPKTGDLACFPTIGDLFAILQITYKIFTKLFT